MKSYAGDIRVREYADTTAGVVGYGSRDATTPETCRACSSSFRHVVFSFRSGGLVTSYFCHFLKNQMADTRTGAGITLDALGGFLA